MTIHQPHDSLFKTALKNKAASIEFFDALLPQHIKQQIDLTTLELSDSSFVDEELKQTSCDLLFSTKFSGAFGYIYLLCEHVRHEVAQLKSMITW